MKGWMMITMRQTAIQNLNNDYTHAGIPIISITSDNVKRVFLAHLK